MTKRGCSLADSLRVAVVGWASWLALAAASPALAQDARPATDSTAAAPQEEGLQEIVVTAQKRTENLQKVPIAISAVSSSTLEDGGVVSTTDLPAVLPGLEVLNIAGQLTPEVRGVGSSFTSPGIEAPIATYVDDVYHAYAADIDLDFADVDQVALLKGPQGTLFGRNATGGVLQVTTRQPSSTFGGSFQTSIDDYLTTRSNLFLTGPVTANTAASLSLSYAYQGDGYGKNIATGDDIGRLDHSLTVRGKTRTEWDDRTTLDLTLDYSSHAGSQDGNYRAFPGFSSIAPSPQPANLFDDNNYLDAYNSFVGGGASAKISHQFDLATLTSISAYRNGSLFYTFSPVPSATPEFNVVVHNFQSEQFTQELQLVSPSDQRLTWALGLYYFYNKATLRWNLNYFNGYNGPINNLFLPSDQSTNSVAGFGQANYKITSGTRVTAGLRYTYDDKTYSSQTIATFLGGAMDTFASVSDEKYSNSSPTWRLSLEQDLARDVMGYISYNRGVKSGGFNTTSTTNPPFAPEKLDAYEAGIKSQFLDNRLRLNAGGFYYKYNDLQIAGYSAGVPNVTNATSANIHGIDADFVAKITSGLSLTASANWLHARFGTYLDAPTLIPNPGFEGGTVGTVNASGRTLPRAPTFTDSIGANYRIPVRLGDLNFNVTDSYNSGFYAEPDNVLRQPSFHLLDASISWMSRDGGYTVRLFANNLLNKAVVGQPSSDAWGYITDYSNPPRVVGVSFKVNF
jgi:iron complex outermembrane recepter protein